MKIKFLLLFLLLAGTKIFGQNTVLLADREIRAQGNEPVLINYGVKEGDKITVTLSTNRDRPINKVLINLASKEVFSQENYSSTSPITFTVSETNFLNLSFWGPALGRNIHVKIERTPADEEGKFFNPSIYRYKKYDTTYVNYQIDSVVGREEIKTPKRLKVISGVYYESSPYVREIRTQTSTGRSTTWDFRLRGQATEGFFVPRPAKDTIRTENKEKIFKGYQVIITSNAGDADIWKLVGTGVDVACLAMSLAAPVAGSAGGIGVKTLFEMAGPQAGGEPVFYSIGTNANELNKFKNKQSYRSVENGLATVYNTTWAPVDTLTVGLLNANLQVTIDVKVQVSYIYQVTEYETISQPIITIKPKTVKVDRTRQVIRNRKSWGLER